MIEQMDINGKRFRPLYWKRKNWWLLPVVLCYHVFFWVSWRMERAAERLNDWVNLKVKK